MNEIIINTLYLVALINPVSKISILTVFMQKVEQKEISSIAGGFVLIWVGFGALRNGVFFEFNLQEKFADISLVPLACPMIAGPATITAVIALHINIGTIQTGVPLILAIFINYIFMKLSIPIGKILQKFNIMGALIRLTGLIVMTMGVQMILDGFSIWLENQ